MPDIKNLKIQNIELNSDESRIECLDVFLELKYNGNFRLCVEADMVLGKKGSLQLIGEFNTNKNQSLKRLYFSSRAQRSGSNTVYKESIQSLVTKFHRGSTTYFRY